MTRRLGPALAAAAGSLLGGNAAAGDGSWQLDSALMYYAEQGRVTAVEPVVTVRKEIGDEESVGVKFVFDTLSGASPNGAPVRPYAQTFTSPSGAAAGGGDEGEGGEDGGEGGGSGYTVPAGRVPLDPHFRDLRSSVAVDWERPLANRLWRSSLGLNYSKETDFLSLGASGTLARDFNKRNTTLTAGLSLESDDISPTGGVPVPLSKMDDALRSGGSERRTVSDVMLGITQVLGRNTIAQFNIDFSLSSGYQNDPYKLLANDAVYASPGEFYYEARPDSRTKQAWYAEIRHAFGAATVVGSFRYLSDDWGIASQTVDLRWRQPLGDGWFVEPHARAYTQTAADFWVESLPSAPLPGLHASADYRLGALDDRTWGIRLGRQTAHDGEASVRVESFRQTGGTAAADLSALIVEFGYSFRW